MPTCEEVARTIASAELATAGWRRRLSVRLHLLMCRHCRRYFRQMREIGTAARRIFDGPPPDPDSQEQLRNSILRRIPPGGKDGS